jgi:hypothetical protein
MELELIYFFIIIILESYYIFDGTQRITLRKILRIRIKTRWSRERPWWRQT